MGKSIVKSREKFTKEQVVKLVDCLVEKLDSKNHYKGEEKEGRKYYHAISGFYKCNYYAIGIYCFSGGRHTIDYSHNTEGRRVLNKILKETINQIKK